LTDFLLAAFEKYGETPAFVWREREWSYRWLKEAIAGHEASLAVERSVVALAADYSPNALAILIALLRRGNVVAPMTAAFDAQWAELLGIAEASTELRLDAEERLSIRPLEAQLRAPLLVELTRRGTGGLLLFSSGSAGRMKAVVHDAARLFEKYRAPRRPKISIPFMLFDHIGGLNTIFHLLSSGGTAVIAPDRSPETIGALIEKHRVQVLPTTPTFLNLLLLRDRRFDLSSLETLAYGAERMPAPTLARLRERFPDVQLVQNYGLSELGIMKTKSESSDSLWMKIEGAKVRVVDGLLELQAPTAMLGYLGEASPFTADGWLRTGDRVEVKGEWLRVLGRNSEIIIVGGEKVYPAEVEDQLTAMPNVLEVIVSGEPNAISGQIVKAEIQTITPESRADFRARMTKLLEGKLLPFKIPQKLVVGTEPLLGARLKKRRR
jgi:long-chain acyl-CoA synthetase